MAENYYSILGIDKNASDDEIKKAYRRLAQKYHPDRNSGNKEAEQQFKKINMAYEVLSDKEKRGNYDQFGEAGAHFDTSQGFNDQGFNGQGFDFSDFNTGFGDIFETFFGSNTRSRKKGGQATRGNDIEAVLKLRFEEAAFGTEKELKVTKSVVCERCKGQGNEPGSKIVTCEHCGGSGEVRTVRSTFLGQMATSRSCDVCGGEGKMPETPCRDCNRTTRIRKTEHIRVKIPEGIDSGATIRLSEKGEGGMKGGHSGDLFIHVEVEPSPIYKRKGCDIYSDKHVHILQVTLGDEIPLETLHGFVQLKIPAGTQSGTLFKVKERGIRRFRGKGIGDHYVRIIVDTPAKLSKRERDLYSQLASEANLKLKPDDSLLKRMGL